jgi:hypothetical protein
VATHVDDLTAKTRVAIEIEHLGAREWAETSTGTMALTGRPEMLVVATSANDPLISASVAFSKKFPRSFVATPPLLGEGPNFRVVPLVQLLAVPEYLLVGHLPAITHAFTDYPLMQSQVAALLEMEGALARTL